MVWGALVGGLVGGLFARGKEDRDHRRAKDLAEQQLQNSVRQGQQAFDFRRQEADQSYRNTWGLEDQKYNNTRGLVDQDYNWKQNLANQDFGFKKTLADDNYGFQIRKANVDDEIIRRQNEQRFGFERTLANDNYSFQDKQRAERERASDETMERDYQMKTETTDRARQTASRAFFGGGNRSNRFNARR